MPRAATTSDAFNAVAATKRDMVMPNAASPTQ
jgi:hypothetical protein